MTIHITHDRMNAERAGQWAQRHDIDRWSVSWLEGDFTRNEAVTAMNIAELVAVNPPMNHPYWRCIETLLAELGLDPAFLDNLIDPEPEDDTEAEAAS